MPPDGSSQRERRSDHPSGRICAVSHVGLVRKRNEDDFYASDDGRLLVVADGLGGMPGGDVASRTAVSALAVRYRASTDIAVAGGERIREFLGEAFLAAHDQILGLSRRRGAYMATTLVAAMVTNDALWVCHVGDVRGYRHSTECLEQMTRDHSLVGELVAAGTISSEEARCHPQRHLVTRALGLPETLEPAFVTGRLDPGDIVVLCTDGLWEAMPHDHLRAIVGSKTTTIRAKADKLVARALAAGGHDNITVVLYEHDAG